MLPLKDDIPTDRLPLVTLLLIAAGAAAQLLLPAGSVLQLLVSALVLWICGTTVEDTMSRPRFLTLCLLAAGAAISLARALDADATATTVAATGAAATALGAYIRLYPRAHVMAVVPVPFASTLVALPMWALLGAWFALQAIFAATSLAGPLADGGAALLLAGAGAFVYGLLAIPLFAQRRKPYPPPLTTPAVS